MEAKLLQLGAELSRRGEPFALATVVRREPASSARTGDCALITRGGGFHGWLGGSCTQPTVVREAEDVIRRGTPRLILMSPTPEQETPRPGLTVLPMTCHSGGSVEIYIEPVLPAPRLVVYGISPAAHAVARFGKVLGYAVEAVDPEADRTMFPEADRIVTDPTTADLQQRAMRDPARLYVVVATLGTNDVAALEQAMTFKPAYLGLVASRARFAEVQASLASRGMSTDALSHVKCPAGLDIGATSPEEIALSILAEIVERARAQSEGAAPRPSREVRSLRADPVCGMQVDPETARYRAEFAGETYVFCCGACREKFLSSPRQFTGAAESRGGTDV